MLTASQLAALTGLFQQGAAEASAALTIWLDRAAKISIDHVEQLPLVDAAQAIGGDDELIGACVMTVVSGMTGQLVLAFDDASGLALADLLLGRDRGTSTQWTELETSAAMETANIVGCAYLNCLSRLFDDSTDVSTTWLPSPPTFVREYAPALMQFMLVEQAMISDVVFFSQTDFRIDDWPVNWHLLLIPDAESLQRLHGKL